MQEEVSLVKKELNEKSENYTSLQLDFQKMSDEKKSIEEQLADVKPLISSKEEHLFYIFSHLGKKLNKPWKNGKLTK